MKRLIVLFLLATSVSAQTANVIELSPADAARAKTSWDNLQKAQHDWDVTYSHLKDVYATEKRPDGSVSTVGYWKEWEFSEDFRFMVPKTSQPPATINNCIVVGCFGPAKYN